MPRGACLRQRGYTSVLVKWPLLAAGWVPAAAHPAIALVGWKAIERGIWLVVCEDPAPLHATAAVSGEGPEHRARSIAFGAGQPSVALQIVRDGPESTAARLEGSQDW